MKRRSWDIARRLAAGTPLTLAQLARENGVSERTIRNDLKEVDRELGRLGLAPVSFDHGRLVAPPGIVALLPTLDGMDAQSYQLAPEERVAAAAALLVSATSPVTLAELADRLAVSRNTVINDLDAIKASIAAVGLAVDSLPGKGLLVVGLESLRRTLLLDIALGALQQGAPPLVSLLPLGGDPRMLATIVAEQEGSHGIRLTDISFDEVLTYLRVLVGRLERAAFIEEQPPVDGAPFAMAQDVLRYVAQSCHVPCPESEVRFLAWLLAGARRLSGDERRTDVPQIQLVTRKLVERVSEELGVDLNDDYELFQNLSNHLEAVLRPEPVTYPDTDLIREVLAENDEVVAAVRKRDAIVRAYVGRPLDELEEGYIALHLCAALERRRLRSGTMRVALACNAGVGTSQLLAAKLRRHFNFSIVDELGAHEVRLLDPSEVSLVISTVPLEGCPVPSVVVTPLLTDEDFVRIGAAIDRLEPSSVPGDETAQRLWRRLEPVVRRHVEAPDELLDELLRELRGYFRDAERGTGPRGDFGALSPSLRQLLPASRIRLDVAARDWRAAVRTAAVPLLEEGLIEGRYVDAILKNVDENGPYIVLSPGFALPHEGLDQGTVEAGLTLVRLSAPVEFGADELDPVRYVCCLSAVDHSTHLKALFSLVNLMKDERARAALDAAEKPEDVVAVLKDWEAREPGGA